MRVGILKAELHVLTAQSLKQKRQVVRGIKDRLISRFDCAASEVDHQDLWQRTALGIAIVSLDAQGADQKLRNIEEFIRSQPGVMPIEFEREIVHF